MGLLICWMVIGLIAAILSLDLLIFYLRKEAEKHIKTFGKDSNIVFIDKIIAIVWLILVPIFVFCFWPFLALGFAIGYPLYKFVNYKIYDTSS